MTDTTDPLATYLITGGLPRVCEELARLMRACGQVFSHCYQLPKLEECTTYGESREGGPFCSNSFHLETAPTSSPGEDNRDPTELLRDKPCHCLACVPQPAFNAMMRCCSLCGNKRCPHTDDHRNVCTSSNALNQVPVTWIAALVGARQELERVRAENARLVEEAASLGSALDKLRIQHSETCWDLDAEASRLRAELAKREAALDEAELMVLKERDAGVACYEEMVFESRKRDAVVDAAREFLNTPRDKRDRRAIWILLETISALCPATCQACGRRLAAAGDRCRHCWPIDPTTGVDGVALEQPQAEPVMVLGGFGVPGYGMQSGEG